jgi:flagellar biosynthesis GTPase FlhF
MREMIESLKKNDGGVRSHAGELRILSTSALEGAYEQLIVNGMDRKIALDLMRKVSFELDDRRRESPEQVMDHLAGEMLQSIQVNAAFSELVAKADSTLPPLTWALVGPTGVGKTTTLAKIASFARLKRGLKVGLINLDTYKVAAFDQLAAYGKILNIPFRSVASAADLKQVLAEYRDLDLILVDTTGRSPRDTQNLKKAQELIAQIPFCKSQLVVSASTKDSDLADVAKRYNIFEPEGLIFSKLDESNVYGSIYNLAEKTKIPLRLYTTGQRVPEDIEEATAERLVSLMIEI